MLDTDARIPYVRRRGEYLYNFWRDAANPRGLWRRTTLDSYRTDAPEWDVLIDVDAVGPRRRRELGVGRRRRHRTRPHPGADQPVAWRLGRRRSCANSTWRHANSSSTASQLPEAKSQVSWEDPDTVLVGTDFGAGLAHRIRLSAAGQAVAPGHAAGRRRDDLRGHASPTSASSASVDRTPGFERTLLRRALDFLNDEVYELRGGELIRIDAPTDASVSLHRHWLLIELRTDWYTRAPRPIAPARCWPPTTTNSSPAQRNCRWCSSPTSTPPCTTTPGPATGWCSSRSPTWPAGSRSSRRAPGTREPVPGIPDDTNTVDRRRRRHRRRVLPGLQRIRHAVAAAARHRPDGPSSSRSSPRRPSSTPKTSRWHSISSHPRTARRSRTSSCGPPAPTAPGPTLLGGYGGFEASRTPGLRRGAGPAVAGPRRHLRAGQHPRRRRVRAGLAHPGDAGGPAPGGRGLRRGGRRSGGPRHHHGRAARRAGRQQRRAADGHHADPVPGAVRRAGVQRAAAGHEALSTCCWPAPRGSPSTATPTTRTTGSSSPNTRRTRIFRPTGATRRC